MSTRPFTAYLDDSGAMRRLQSEFARWPEGAEKAKRRALKKVATWAQRQVVAEVAKSVGTPQKVFKALSRFSVKQGRGAVTIWIGTLPLDAHHLGKVRWTRRMPGARAGKSSFPGAWSWPEGSGIRTAGLVMDRTGVRGRNQNHKLERIDKVSVPIYDRVILAVDAVMPKLSERFDTLLRQELNYALNVEARR